MHYPHATTNEKLSPHHAQSTQVGTLNLANERLEAALLAMQTLNNNCWLHTRRCRTVDPGAPISLQDTSHVQLCLSLSLQLQCVIASWHDGIYIIWQPWPCHLSPTSGPG
jgi:hypothetical protein